MREVRWPTPTRPTNRRGLPGVRTGLVRREVVGVSIAVLPIEVGLQQERKLGGRQVVEPARARFLDGAGGIAPLAGCRQEPGVREAVADPRLDAVEYRAGGVDRDRALARPLTDRAVVDVGRGELIPELMRA